MGKVIYDSHGFECEDVTEEVAHKPKTYLAGHMLDAGAVMRREWEADQLRSLGANLYVPHEDKTINDKANAVQEGLAERIVENDTKGLIESDVIIIDAHENGKGTLVELGQLKGMKDMAKMINDYIEEYMEDNVDPDYGYFYDFVDDLVKATISKKIYAHNTDIRRANSDPQAGDRREYAPNQYVYGTVLDLTDGYGFYEWDEIERELKTDG